MIEVDDQMIRQMVQTIVKEVSPEKIILFGSRASGEATPESDVDLLIVEKESAFEGRSRWRETARIRQALWDFPVPIDILLFTTEEVHRWKDAVNHVIARSFREGTVIYDRS
jgi:predicted nucleotidyltransferase